MTAKDSGSTTGRILSILVFLGGVALIGLTFKMAFDMFAVQPQTALGVKPDAPLDVNGTVQQLVGIIGRILLLLVMAGTGSILANVGIRFFTAPMYRKEIEARKEKREAARKESASDDSDA